MIIINFTQNRAYSISNKKTKLHTKSKYARSNQGVIYRQTQIAEAQRRQRLSEERDHIKDS